jgi:hypothetical protein
VSTASLLRQVKQIRQRLREIERRRKLSEQSRREGRRDGQERPKDSVLRVGGRMTPNAPRADFAPLPSSLRGRRI